MKTIAALNCYGCAGTAKVYGFGPLHGTECVCVARCSTCGGSIAWAHDDERAPQFCEACSTQRNATPTLRSIAVALLVATTALFAVGCGVNVGGDRGPAPSTVTSLTTYAVDRCGDFKGYKGLLAADCNADDVLVDARCEVHGGPADTSLAHNANGWECATTWNDSAAGGSICVHLTCEPGR